MYEVGDVSASEFLSTQFSKRELYRVNYIALPGTVGARNYSKAAVKVQGYFLPESLETSKINPANVDQVLIDPAVPRQTLD